MRVLLYEQRACKAPNSPETANALTLIDVAFKPIDVAASSSCRTALR